MCIWTHAQTLHLCHARLSSYLIFDMTSRTSSCSFFYFLLLGLVPLILFFFFFKDTAPPEISPLPLHDPLPILVLGHRRRARRQHDPRLFRRREDVDVGRKAIRVVERAHAHEAHRVSPAAVIAPHRDAATRSEEHTSELQSLAYLVCRLLLEKKK